MVVYNQDITGSDQAHFRYFDFSRFVDGRPGTIFIDSPQVFTRTNKNILTNNRVIYLELEEPNRFFVNVDWFNHFEYDQFFNHVFSICPYTTEWYKKLGHTNRKHSFIPINEKTIPESSEKIYDIIYAGHIVSDVILNEIKVISKFNYKFISNSVHPLITDSSATNEEKLKLISKSKITLTHGLLYPTKKHINFIKTIPHIEYNRAFSKLEDGIVPQIKGRTFEAALCRSLILCKKDPWNVIEYYFEPDKDFIYYESGKLSDTVENILTHYDYYEKIVESAYKKAQEYTTCSFFNKYLKGM